MPNVGSVNFPLLWHLIFMLLAIYSETCDEGTPQKVSLHDRCPLVTGTFQC